MAKGTAKTATVGTSDSVFVNNYVAIVEGGDALSDAQELQEHAGSILETQIQIKNGSKHEKKRAVKNAEKALEKALLNGGKVIEGAGGDQQYLANIVSAKKSLDESQAALDKVDEDIQFLQGILDIVNA